MLVWSGGPDPLGVPSLSQTVLLIPVGGTSGLTKLCVNACLGGLWEPGMGSQQVSDLWFALILHLDTDSEEQTLPFPAQVSPVAPPTASTPVSPSDSGSEYSA